MPLGDLHAALLVVALGELGHRDGEHAVVHLGLELAEVRRLCHSERKSPSPARLSV